MKKTILLSCFAASILCMGGIQAQELIPVEKNLSPAWVKSLYDRGEPTTYLKSRNELQYIGMPVGGITAGGVYLGGDGRMWLWDIFNENQEGVEPKLVQWAEGKTTHDTYVRSRDGACYVQPAKDIRPLQQGFLLRFEYDTQTIYKTLEEKDWDEIAFEATYPVGTIRYTDRSLPVELVLQAYSPFIPLNEDDSALPATILSFSVANKGDQPVKVSILGFLENKVGIHTADNTACLRLNEAVRSNGMVSVTESLDILRTGRNVQQFDLGNSRDSIIRSQPDFGTMCISALQTDAKAYCDLNPGDYQGAFRLPQPAALSKPLQEALIGGVQTDLTVSPQATGTADFVISWYFPNLSLYPKHIKDSGRYYQHQFSSALDVTQYIADNFNRLSSTSLLWKETWQESTLPHWFLERTFLTINTMATTNAHRFKSGRFWAWEGVGACPGTCTHVWQYAQAMGRIFPALERDCRERTDLNIAMQDNGGIIFRAEMETRPAIDGQAGTVLRCYREHQMSADNAFLKRNWPQIKRAVQFILAQDKNGDGMEDTPMENTLDAVWDGEIAWIVGLCISGVRAGQEMAEEAGDTVFAAICADYVRKGSKNMDKYLFNGEYYIHRPDKEKGRTKLGSYNTSHIDQVMGQSWAFQVGLGRIQDQQKTRSALRSLWKYNYTPDVGPYIAVNQGGRPYALAGEGGMIMNTNPKKEAKPYGDNVTWQMGYFHECMSGFEYQVASHLIAEGMTDEGLVLVRSIHDRYHAAKRNPFNEIECSDHYARAMASYGAFITACGFEYHGPKGYMRFAPKWGADNFKAPFTAAEGWGTYAQQQAGGRMTCTLMPKYGKVQLESFSVVAPKGKSYRSATVTVDGQPVRAEVKQKGRDITLSFSGRVAIETGKELKIVL